MNNIDVITRLAQYEGRNLKPDTENIIHLPNFTCTGNKVTHIDNYIDHDNAPRLPYFTNILNNTVLPNLTSRYNIHSRCNRYGIELHDSNSYLSGDLDYSNVMVWARAKNDKKSVLIPDIYQFENYVALNIDDQTEKKNKIGFFGTTTGSRDPTQNTRINMCLWAIDKDYIDCYITKIAQMSTESFKSVKNSDKIMHEFVKPSDLFKYKYLLDIPGNTYSWNRVPIVLNSNSLLFKMPCSDHGWYYPLLHPGEHYVDVNIHNMESKFMYYENNPREVAFIIENANRFVNNYLKPIHAVSYMVALFQESDYWFGK